MCRANPRDRLGAGKDGIEEIRKQKWYYSSFMTHCWHVFRLGALNWNALRGRTLISPIKQPYNGPSDARNFDMFAPETSEPADETSNWDHDFWFILTERIINIFDLNWVIVYDSYNMSHGLLCILHGIKAGNSMGREPEKTQKPNSMIQKTNKNHILCFWMCSKHFGLVFEIVSSAISFKS